MNGNAGHGVQVVDVTASHEYLLSEEVLRELCAEAGALPVVVVSVAGNFRGGKSFLLDFFLRYLNATDADRKSGAWLGKDDEPLVGFQWSTVHQRNTIGIHIWSRPFPMTLSNGEKVAVVLMDTQGTFDNESTMRDSTTIFALSTLLSSVQIYNIIRNIEGSHLQHLQYFSEFARLVANDAQPFQHLTFLIRDWGFSSLPYGADGGKRLLDRVLEGVDSSAKNVLEGGRAAGLFRSGETKVTPDLPPQQQELRRHLRTCFEEIDCFLMAHPGFADSEKENFNGCLADLRPAFRACLKEFVPLVFAPNRLMPKRINGQPLTAPEFMHYFRTYMNAFNNDTLPTPDTILQATTEAGLLLATEAARAQYTAAIEAGAGDHLLPTAAVYRLHSEAIAAARNLFTSRRIMGNRQRIDEALAQLMQELDGHLRDFASVSEHKLSKASAAAMEAYEERMLQDVPESQLCATPAALEAKHRAAAAAVADAFRARLHDNGDDEETQRLIKDLKARYTQMVHFNELNNNGYVSEALAVYVKEMDKCTSSGQPCMSDQELKAKHTTALEAARKYLKQKRNCCTGLSLTKDQYFARLDKDIKVQYERFTQLNKSNGESVVLAMVSTYKENFSKLFGPNMKCLPPSKFYNDDEKERKKVREMYHARRTVGSDEGEDSCWEEIEQAMTEHYNQMYETNKELNKAAVEAACAEYRSIMDTKTEALLPSLKNPVEMALLPLRVAEIWLKLEEYHEMAKKSAIQKFKSHRRDGRVEDDDKYYNRLIKQIDNLYELYKNPFKNISREIGFDEDKIEKTLVGLLQ